MPRARINLQNLQSSSLLQLLYGHAVGQDDIRCIESTGYDTYVLFQRRWLGQNEWTVRRGRPHTLDLLSQALCCSTSKALYPVEFYKTMPRQNPSAQDNDSSSIPPHKVTNVEVHRNGCLVVRQQTTYCRVTLHRCYKTHRRASEDNQKFAIMSQLRPSDQDGSWGLVCFRLDFTDDYAWNTYRSRLDLLARRQLEHFLVLKDILDGSRFCYIDDEGALYGKDRK